MRKKPEKKEACLPNQSLSKGKDLGSPPYLAEVLPAVPVLRRREVRRRADRRAGAARVDPGALEGTRASRRLLPTPPAPEVVQQPGLRRGVGLPESGSRG